jgi:radical SAM superfamily enzyme YgiQ (UPF0313 family)
MVDGTLTINPAMRVFHARGAFFAGWQPMDKVPIALSESDFVLLSVINDANHLADVVRNFRAKLRACAMQDCPRLYSRNRIKELRQARVLLSAADGDHSPQVNGSIVDFQNFESSAAVNETFLKRRLRVSRNFMLRPLQSGFQIWSSVSRSHHILSLDLVFVLISFSTGKEVSQLIAESNGLTDISKVPRAIGWLHDNGLLISVKEVSMQPNRRVESTAINTAAGDKSAKTGQAQRLTGRIPIYFVPHMANHYPLALGMMFSFVTGYKDGALMERFMPVPIEYQKNPADILNGAYNIYGKGIWLFSNYMWSVTSNLKISAAVKDHDNRNITIHGGPSTPGYALACSKFMMQHKCVDVAVHGEGELAIAEILESLGPEPVEFAKLNDVRGITFRRARNSATGLENEDLVRTGPRARIQDLDMLPSPYLTGVFDAYGSSTDAAIIESNRGCPFGCTFCDWGSATMQKIRKYDLQRVKDEIEWIGENQVRVIWIADANFGIYDRDIEITEWICKIKEKHGYPMEVVVNYTKNATKRLAKIVKLFASNNICSQGVISIQTRDPFTLEVINRKNIKTDKYNDLAEIFRTEGLPLSTDLMIGLPGMTVESFKADLQYFFDMDVTVKAYPTELLPNSPMADPDYMEKYEIEVDENNFLVSTFSYSRDDLHEMNVIYYLYTVADSFSILRYVLRYLRWDHGILALDFLQKLHDELEKDPYRYPAIAYMSKVFQHYMNVPGGWQQFYNEVADFTETTFGVRRDAGFDAVLHFNEIVMPDDALTYPLNVRLEHDVSAYFLEHNSKPTQHLKLLTTYPPTDAIIDDKFLFGHINYNREQYDSHQIFWELQSPVSRIQSVPNFM